MDDEREIAHLSHPAILDAEREWDKHFEQCRQCRRAPGLPPPDCPPEQRELYACDDGIRLHEAAVLAAHAAYQEDQHGRR